MKTRINTKVFKHNDDKFIDFFNIHGWVIIEDFIPLETISLIKSKFESLKKEKAHELNIDINDYEEEITQWRDLWQQDKVFEDMIFDDHGVHSLARKSMKWSGIKLLHDHLLNKRKDTSSVFPWHQDSMFWPVDVEGCSVWTPLEDISKDAGCLEVIDSSHLKGCDKPLDFMAEEKNDFHKDTVKILLPIKKGSTLLLHSFTYHRSSPNIEIQNRTAYLTLWVHPDAKWRPDLVDWHPINKHVESKERESLQGEMFPVFGDTIKLTKSAKDIHTGTDYGVGISMFNSTDKIKEQFEKILGKTDNLFSEKNRLIIVERTIECGICKDEKVLQEVLYKMMIAISSYKQDGSRNVFNSSYKKWWTIAGEAWENYQKNL